MVFVLTTQYFRRCVRFLKPGSTEGYRQKAIDLRGPPTLPKPIQLLRARGILEVEGAEDKSGDDGDKSGDDGDKSGDEGDKSGDEGDKAGDDGDKASDDGDKASDCGDKSKIDLDTGMDMGNHGDD